MAEEYRGARCPFNERVTTGELGVCAFSAMVPVPNRRAFAVRGRNQLLPRIGRLSAWATYSKRRAVIGSSRLARQAG